MSKIFSNLIIITVLILSLVVSAKAITVNGSGGLIPPAGQIGGTITDPTVIGLTFGSLFIPLDINGLTSGNCLEYNGTVITGGTCSGGSGTGTVVAAPQYYIPYYSSPGTSQSVSGTAISNSLVIGNSASPPSAYTGSGPLAAHNFGTTISPTGVLTGAQPAFTDISGTAAVSQGGTGATAAGPTAAGNIGALAKANNLSDVANVTTSRTNLVAAKSGANSDITSLSGLTTPLSIAQGGTNLATLVAHSLLLGEGTASMGHVGPCNTGSFLYGQTGIDPICSTLTLPNSATSNYILYASSTNTISSEQLVTVNQGGTNCSGPTVVASLPGSPTAGELCSVTDATSCVGIVTGGGSLFCSVIYNGTNWVANTNLGPAPCVDPGTAAGELYLTGTPFCPTATAAFSANGQIPIWDASHSTLTPKTITPGTGIAITNAAGSITINATGGGSGSGTVNNSVQSNIPIYSASGTSNIVSGYPPNCQNIMGPPWNAACDGSTDDTAIFDKARQTGGCFYVPPGTPNNTPSGSNGTPRHCELQAFDIGAAAVNNSYCTALNQPSWCCTGNGTGTCGIAVNSQCTGPNTPSPCCSGSGTGSCTTSINYNRAQAWYGGQTSSTWLDITQPNNTTASESFPLVATGGAVQNVNVDGAYLSDFTINNTATYSGNPPTRSTAAFSTLPNTCFLLDGNQPVNDAHTYHNIDLTNSASAASGQYNPIGLCSWGGINRFNIDHVHMNGSWGLNAMFYNAANDVGVEYLVAHANYSNISSGVTFDTLPSILYYSYGAGVVQDFTFCVQTANCTASDGGQQFVFEDTYASAYNTAPYFAFAVPGTKYTQGQIVAGASNYWSANYNGTDINTISTNNALTTMWAGMPVKVCLAGSGCTTTGGSAYVSTTIVSVNSNSDITVQTNLGSGSGAVGSNPAVNGYCYRDITAGTNSTDSTPTTPVWPTVTGSLTTTAGSFVADGSLTWQNMGSCATYWTNAQNPNVVQNNNISNINGVEGIATRGLSLTGNEFGAQVAIALYSTGTGTQVSNGNFIRSTTGVTDPIAGVIFAGTSSGNRVSGLLGNIGTTEPAVRADFLSTEGTSSGNYSGGGLFSPTASIIPTGLSTANWSVLQTSTVTLIGDPTGTVSSTAYLQQAINSACNGGTNGSVYIPAGTWTLGPISNYTGPCTIYGSGPSTIIQPDTSITWSSGQCMFSQTSGNGGVTYRDLIFNDPNHITGGPIIPICGTSESNTLVRSIQFNSSNNNFKNCIDFDAASNLHVTDSLCSNSQSTGFLVTSINGSNNDILFDGKDTVMGVGIDSPGRSFADGMTATNFTITSAAGANFTSADVGRGISGTNILAGTLITAVNSSTSVTINVATTGTGGPFTLTLGPVPTSTGDGFACLNSNSFSCTNVRMIGDFASNVSGISFEVAGTGTSVGKGAIISNNTITGTGAIEGNGCVLCQGVNDCLIVNNHCSEIGSVTGITADIMDSASNATSRGGVIANNLINQPNGGFGNGIEVFSNSVPDEISDVNVDNNKVIFGTNPTGSPFALVGYDANATWSGNLALEGTPTTPLMSFNCTVTSCLDLNIQNNNANMGSMGIFVNNVIHSSVQNNMIQLSTAGIDVSGTLTGTIFAPNNFYNNTTNIVGANAIPTVSSCGSGPVQPVSPSTNMAGQATNGTGSTTCILTFAPSLVNKPVDISLHDITTPTNTLFYTALTTAGFTVNGLTASDTFSWSLPNASN